MSSKNFGTLLHVGFNISWTYAACKDTVDRQDVPTVLAWSSSLQHPEF